MMKSNGYKFDPIGFYKRAYYHFTTSDADLTNLSGNLPPFSGKISYGNYPMQDMTIFVLLHMAHIVCALFQIKRSVDYNVGKKIWKKVRFIPKTLRGPMKDGKETMWDPRFGITEDRLEGSEQYGNQDDDQRAWAINFKLFEYTHVKVESDDRKHSEMFHIDEEKVIDLPSSRI